MKQKIILIYLPVIAIPTLKAHRQYPKSVGNASLYWAIGIFIFNATIAFMQLTIVDFSLKRRKK
jgi:hypothetical protein